MNKILDELDGEEITYDHVKQAWLDKYGCRLLPHNNFLGAMLRMHDDWIPVGVPTSGKISYRRRATAASD